MSERVRVRESMGERKKEYGRDMEGERETERDRVSNNEYFIL